MPSPRSPFGSPGPRGLSSPVSRQGLRTAKVNYIGVPQEQASQKNPLGLHFEPASTCMRVYKCAYVCKYMHNQTCMARQTQGIRENVGDSDEKRWRETVNFSLHFRVYVGTDKIRFMCLCPYLCLCLPLPLCVTQWLNQARLHIIRP